MSGSDRPVAALTAVGGVLMLFAPLLGRGPNTALPDGLTSTLLVAAPLFGVVGVYGLSRRYGDRDDTIAVFAIAALAVGIMGLVGFSVSYVGNFRGLGIELLFACAAAVGVLAFEVGAILLGWLSYRTGDPAWTLVLLLPLALPLQFLVPLLSMGPFSYPNVAGGFYGLAWAAVGVHLWCEVG